MSGEAIGPDTIVCWSGAPVATAVNDEIVLMNLERDRCYGLGATGSDLWRRLEKPTRQCGILSHSPQVAVLTLIRAAI